MLLLAVTACGAGEPEGIIDLAADADPDLELPDFFPVEWDVPARATLVDVEVQPDDPTIGPWASWVVDDDHQGVVNDVETILASLRWTPQSQGAQRTFFLLDNGRAYSITVFTTPSLKGTRLTLELPIRAS